MKNQDKSKFAGLFRMMANLYPHAKISNDQVQAYWKTLKEYPIEAVESAIMSCPASFPKHMPAAGELLELTKSKVKTMVNDVFGIFEPLTPLLEKPKEPPTGPRCKQLMLEWDKVLSGIDRVTPRSVAKTRLKELEKAFEEDSAEAGRRRTRNDAKPQF